MKKAYQKKRIYQQKHRFDRKKNEPLQLTLDRAAVLEQMQDGLHQFGVELGLSVAAMVMAEEVTRLCGETYKHQTRRRASRHGKQTGVVTIAGQKVSLERPRVRSTAGRGEVGLESYRILQREDAMPWAVLQRAVRGVSCRDYQGAIESVKDGFGVKRSSVSRAFTAASRKVVAEFRERRFDGVRYPVIFIDGICYADTMITVVMGIAEDGRKKILGFREGATENGTVVKALLEDLIERGLPAGQPTLFVLDGSKALRKAVSDLWGQRALVQRCRVHKKRNVQAHVQEQHWPEVERMLARAWNQPDPDKALESLKTLSRYLERLSPDASASLKEGMEETLTVTRLRVDAGLASHLNTTNPVESAFSMTRRLTGRVKRWRGGDMKHRWCGTGLIEAEKRFRRIKGYQFMRQLMAALDATLVKESPIKKSA